MTNKQDAKRKIHDLIMSSEVFNVLDIYKIIDDIDPSLESKDMVKEADKKIANLEALLSCAENNFQTCRERHKVAIHNMENELLKYHKVITKKGIEIHEKDAIIKYLEDKSLANTRAKEEHIPTFEKYITTFKVDDILSKMNIMIQKLEELKDTTRCTA